MALASCHVGIVSHGAGQSAIAASAYRAAVKLHNDYDGLTYDYTRKKGVIYSGILAPQNTPERLLDRNTLWNEHLKAQLKKNGELRDDAQLARQVTIALPKEFTREQNIELAKAYAQVFVAQGMVVDFSVHDKGDGNPHAHNLLTMRDISEDGFSKKKNGNWDRKDYVAGWRKSYEDITNRYLEMNGFEERICVDSYEKQGIDRIPTVHLGAAAHHMEQRGIETDRGNINRDILKTNQEIEEINREIDLLKHDVEYLKGLGEYTAEKEQDEPFRHDRAAEHSREYSISDDTIAPYSMGAEEERIGIEEPLSDTPVEDLIEHYTMVLENVKKTSETVGIILTERGKQSLEVQQRNLENTLKQLTQQLEQKSKEPPAPEPHRRPPPPETVRTPVPEPSRPPARWVHEPQPRSSEPELLRQRKRAQESESEQHGKETGSRSPPRDPSSLYSGGRTLAQQRRIAQGRQEQQHPGERTQQPASAPRPHEGRTLAQQRRVAQEHQEQQHPGERTPQPASVSPSHEGRTLAQQRRAAQERQERQQRQVEDLKPEQTSGSLPRHHEQESLWQQRQMALDRKNKDPVPEVYKGQPQHHGRGDDMRRMAPDDGKESHHEAERGRVHIQRHDKKP